MKTARTGTRKKTLGMARSDQAIAKKIRATLLRRVCRMSGMIQTMTTTTAVT
jgi:hypothetical protein